MGGTSTCISNETQHLVQVQLCGFRRSQVSGNRDNFVLNRGQIDDGQTQDIAQQALTDVTYVSRTFLQVFIVQLFQADA